MKASRSLLWLLFGLIVLTLTSCQQDQAAEKTTVSFAFAGDAAEFDAYTKLILTFENQHPNIDIQMRHAPSRQDFQQKLVTMLDAGSPPDVVLLNYRRIARFVADGDLHPVGSHAAELDIEREAFFPIALDAFTYQDELWCVPQNISSLVVYFNQDLFDLAGVAYPAAGWDWDDFLQAAIDLTDEPKRYGAGVEPNLYRLAPFVWQANGAVYDENLDLLPPIEPNIRAMSRFTALQTVYQVVPDQTAAAAQSVEERFLAGHIGMLFDSRRLTPTLRQAADFRWDVAPLPQGERVASVLHSDGYCLGRSPSAATLEFIRFATSETGQRLMAETGRTVPSLQSVAHSTPFLDSTQPPAASHIWLDGVEHLERVPHHPDWIQWEKEVSAELSQLFYGNITLEMFLETLEN